MIRETVRCYQCRMPVPWNAVRTHDCAVRVAERNPPLLPISVREYFNDGTVAFFAHPAPKHPNDIVQRVLSGRIAAAEVRYRDGGMVIVRRKSQ